MNNDSDLVRARHLESLATAAKNYTLAELAELTLSGGDIDGYITELETVFDNSEATTLQGGLMSASDKTKLDGIADNANNYTLPTASSSTKGGVKVGTGLSMDGDTLNCTVTATTYSEATTLQGGLMSANDKTKLDGIADNANNYTLPTASSSTKGGVKVGTGLSMDGDTLNCTISGGTGSSGAIVLSTTPSTVEGAIWLDVDW